MHQFLSLLSRNQSNAYKLLLLIGSIVLVIYMLPKGGQFKYQFQKGKPWQYENLYAPFNFTIKKDNKALEEERESIKRNAVPFFDLDPDIPLTALQEFSVLLDLSYQDSAWATPKNKVKQIGLNLVNKIYKNGVLGGSGDDYLPEQVVNLRVNNQVRQTVFSRVVQRDELEDLSQRETQAIPELENIFIQIIATVVKPNLTFNTSLTEASVQELLADINPNIGVVEKGARIIAKGEVVEGEKYEKLNSLRDQFQSQVWSKSNYNWLVFGYTMLVSLVFVMLILFLRKYRPEIYEHNTKVSFIFINMLLMIFVTTLVIKLDAAYVYLIPLCVLPIVLKSFFDARLGLFAHVLTLLLLGFVVPNSFEFIFLQIIAGIVTILTVSELSKRANLFISVGQITGIYILGYLAFFIVQEGSLERIALENFAYFLICGLITLFAFPLIYAYERLFGLVSEVSLLELSNTNTPLLKELSNKAPGTFHHSLNVANLAEAAAQEIGADSMLVRVGALYHDIGKMNNPTNFTENQVHSINTLNDLEPTESAKIIIGHVIKGIELARKYKLPERIIDFIRTHHGTNLVYFFYKKEMTEQGIAQEQDFRYPGPKPFSKETAILMMADSVEAASKSLKEPTSAKINDFVESIVDMHMEQGQFDNANITFKEIGQIKKVLKKKLTNMYHLRVAYPE
ncbi:MAG: HDIG domain-containing protein [Bacteroidetes bacterium]|nr:HDIG domain-containing protein [Bacteroidota bacterium]MDA1210554.1 HDIG domain-containing protein [Bacteroidota bacterium]